MRLDANAKGSLGGLILIHASARDATKWWHYSVSKSGILIHASTRDATWQMIFYHLHNLYFNPRIREGCDCTASGILSNTAFILIHASARDATNLLVLCRHFKSDFNPRIREGCDSKIV